MSEAPERASASIFVWLAATSTISMPVSLVKGS